MTPVTYARVRNSDDASNNPEEQLHETGNHTVFQEQIFTGA